MVRAALIALVALFWWSGAVSQTGQPVPALSARVTDSTGTLSDAQRSTLEQALKDHEARKGSQIAVLIVPTTQPETIEQYSIRVVEQWKLGRARVDDGVLLIVAKNDRTLRIEVGYGLEGVLTDATSNRIIEDIIVPRFRQGDFYGGISAGVDSIMRVIDGEPLPPPRHSRGGGTGSLLPVLFVLTMVAGGVLRTLFGRLPGAVVTGGAVGFVAWLLSGAILVAVVAGVISLVFTLIGAGMGTRVGGPYIGGHPGGWGRGSGSDIFRGGGGGFGGGGASGRW